MSEQQRARVSGYSEIDQADDPTRYIRKLDERGATILWRAIKARMLTMLDVREGERIIDVGCGTGNDVRELARIVGPRGRVVGLDASNTMIEVARDRSKGSRFPVEFYVGDAHHLPFPDGSFDCCRVERVLQHLSDPERAIGELLRVTRAGGRIIIVEPDYGAVTFKGSNPSVTRKLTAHRCSHYKSGRIGMLLPILLKRIGFVDLTILHTEVITTVVEGEAEKLLVENYVEPAVLAGLVSEEEGQRWIMDLKVAETKGQYNYAIPLFVVGGLKPTEK